MSRSEPSAPRLSRRQFVVAGGAIAGAGAVGLATAPSASAAITRDPSGLWIVDPTLAPYNAVPNDTAFEFGPVWDQVMSDLIAAGGGVLFLRHNVFYTSRAPVEGANGQFAQLPLPYRSNAAGKLVIEIRGARQGLFSTFGQTGTQAISAGGIVSLREGQAYSPTRRTPSLIGGPVTDPAGNTPVSTFTNLQVIISDCTIRCPDNPSLTAVDLSGVQQARVFRTAIDTPSSFGATTAVPTNAWAFGLIMPTVNNNAVSRITDSSIIGYYANLGFNEHVNVDDLLLLNGRVALVPWGPFAYHSSRFGYLTIENHRHLFAAVDPANGVLNAPRGRFAISFTNLDIEDGGGPYAAFAPVDHIRDSGNLHGSIAYVRVVGGVGTVTGLMVTGSTKARLTDLNAVAAPPGAVVADSFNRVDNLSSLGTPDLSPGRATWQALSGTWGIRSKAAAHTGTAGSLVYDVAAIQSDKTDGGVQMTIVMSPTPSGGANGSRTDAGIAARVANASNLLFVEVIGVGTQNTPQVALFKRIAGAFTLLAPHVAVSAAPGTTHTVRLVLSGNRHQVFWDNAGTPLIDVTSTTGLENNTMHGLCLGRAESGNDDGLTRIDDFSVA